MAQSDLLIVDVVTLPHHHGFLNHVMMPLVKMKTKIMGVRYVKLTRNVLIDWKLWIDWNDKRVIGNWSIEENEIHIISNDIPHDDENAEGNNSCS